MNVEIYAMSDNLWVGTKKFADIEEIGYLAARLSLEEEMRRLAKETTAGVYALWQPPGRAESYLWTRKVQIRTTEHTPAAMEKIWHRHAGR